MKTSDFYYELPEELIAQSPAEVRSASRLLVYNRKTKIIEDKVFSDIIDYLDPGDVLVRNTTRVIPARLYAHRPDTGGAMEFLLLKRLDERRWECLVKPGRRARPGRSFKINDELSATVLEVLDDGNRVIRLDYEGIFEEVLDRAGEVPLPPYITERVADKERYQTVYANENGSAELHARIGFDGCTHAVSHAINHQSIDNALSKTLVEMKLHVGTVHRVDDRLQRMLTRLFHDEMLCLQQLGRIHLLVEPQLHDLVAEQAHALHFGLHVVLAVHRVESSRRAARGIY